MTDLVKTVLDRFQRPLVVVLAALSAVFLLPAFVFDTVSVSGMQGAALNERAKLVTGVLGLLLLLLLLLTVWYDSRASASRLAASASTVAEVPTATRSTPAASEPQPEASERSSLPDELRLPLLVRRANVSGRQEAILRFVTNGTRAPGTHVQLKEIDRQLAIPETEAYYRLEHPRLLGLVDAHRLGEGIVLYRLPAALEQQAPVRQPTYSMPASGQWPQRK